MSSNRKHTRCRHLPYPLLQKVHLLQRIRLYTHCPHLRNNPTDFDMQTDFLIVYLLILWRSAYRIVCCNDNDAKHHYCLKSHTDRLTDCLTFYMKNVKARHMKWTRHKAGIISQTISLFRLYTYLSLTAWIKYEHGQFIKFWFLMVVQ